MRRRSFITGFGSAVVAPMLWLRLAAAQQVAKPVIGFLTNGTESSMREALAVFLQGLREQGFVEGRNVEILSRHAESQEDRLPALAADLVQRRVAAIFVVPNVGFARIAKNATATIPIVFAAGGDPVESGLVASLNRPGGNVTGATFLTIRLVAKRLEILHQIVPTATSIGYLINPNNPQLEAESREVEAAARDLGVRVVAAKASTADEIGLAVASLMEQKVGAMLPAADTLFVVQAEMLVALADRYALPTIYIGAQWVRAGGLVSYSGNGGYEAHRIAGTYVGRILKGAKPSDLPVQQSTRIVASGALTAPIAAKAATSTIPIVFVNGGDPVKYGLAASLNRPGGNVTGVTLLSAGIGGKRLSLLRELLPHATTVAYLSPSSSILTYEEQKSDILAGARALGQQVIVAEVGGDLDFEAAFTTFVEHGAAAVVVAAVLFFFGVPGNRDKIFQLAARHKIPAIYPSRADAVAGGLMSYGADVVGAHRQLGVQYVAQILKGAKPADLPVQQPTKFELVINLKTAKALGLEIPRRLLVQADEVIE